MTSPLPIIVDSEDRGMMRLTIDPNGSWSSTRFEFCNALEEAVLRPDDPQPWAKLATMGVRRIVPTRREAPPILLEE